MYDLSFVIYFHSSRLNNLQQMVRILSRREDISRTELVLVCQDKCNWAPDGFRAVKMLSLEMPTYNKPVLCNRGVEASAGRITALLDSDRILPAGWFARSAADVRPGQILTTINLSWLVQAYTDEEIETGDVETILDLKSPSNDSLRKNAFSGNTIMHREDYLSVLMDESYVNYGFADSDMVERCRSRGFEFIYKTDPEFHLYHEKYVIVNEQQIPRIEFRVYTLLNGLRYHIKWKKPPSLLLMDLYRAVRQEMPDSPHAPEIEKLMSKMRTM